MDGSVMTALAVRPAVEDDIPVLLNIAKTFIEEARYGWDYCPEVAENTWRGLIANDKTECLMVHPEGEPDNLGGGIIVAHDRDFTLQRVGYVIKFYIMPEFRGTRASRMSVEAACEWFREHHCWAAFATSTANIGKGKMFINLFGKFGFVDMGPTLMRDFTHE